MDKTIDYILMCQKSKEIQDCWQHKAGDYFADDNGDVNCWVPGVIGAPDIKNSFGVEPEDNLIRLTKYTWLPRYNQLIELAQRASVAYRDMTFAFYTWVDSPYANTGIVCKKVFVSLEQLWLAFVMEKNFHKWWNDDRWISV